MDSKKVSTSSEFAAFPAPREKQTLQLVTKEEFDKHTEALAGQKKLLDWTFGFIIAVLVVCVIGYLTFLLDALKFHSETEERFTEELHAAHKESIDSRFATINSRLDSIAAHPRTDTQLYLPMQQPHLNNSSHLRTK
jgi:hypothetical protein